MIFIVRYISFLLNKIEIIHILYSPSKKIIYYALKGTSTTSINPENGLFRSYGC